jgi:hypothetical protein
MEHRSLTGDSLHEPKGIESASSGSVYVANGAGTGSWVDRFSGLFTANQLSVTGSIPDISTAGSSFFAAVPTKSQLTKVTVVLSGTIAGTNAVVTIRKNGVAQTPTITINTTGSGGGVSTVTTVSPPISLVEGDVLEFRSDGASDNSVVASVVAKLTAVA